MSTPTTLTLQTSTLDGLSRKHLDYAQGYLLLGMHQDAESELIKISPDHDQIPEVLETRLDLAFQLEDWGRAVPLATILISQSPGCADWRIQLAFAIRRLKGIPEARAILEEAERLFPKEATIPYNLACYACCEGRNEAAVSLLKKAFRLDSVYRKISLDDPDLISLREQIRLIES